MMTRTATLLVGLLLWSLSTSIGFADDGDDLFALAAGYYNQQRWEAAAEQLATLLAEHPDHRQAVQASFFRGEALLQLGDYDASQQQFRDFLKRWPNESRVGHATFRVGEASFLSGDLATAREWLERFERAYPRDELCQFAWTYLGELDLGGEAWGKAQGRFESVLSRWPEGTMSERCRFGLGRALDGQGLAQEAMRFYRYVGFEGTSDLVDEALFNLAILQFHLQDPEGVETTVKRLTEEHGREPLAARGQYLLGRSRQRAGDLDAAIEAFHSGLSLAVEQGLDVAPALLYEIALTHEQLQQPEEAAGYWERIVREYPTSDFSDDAYQQRIEQAFADEKWDLVEELVGSFLAEHPQSTWTQLAREYQGRALLQRGEYAAAGEVFSELLGAELPEALSDEQRTYAYLLGLSLVRQRLFDQSLPYLTAACAGLEEGPMLSGTLLALETAYAGLERHADVIPAATRYLERFPQGLESARVRRDLCLALVAEQQWSQADEALEAYLEVQSEHSEFSPTVQRMADLAYQENQFKLASKWFGHLVEHQGEPTDRPIVYLAVAWSRSRAGEAETAQTWFQRLIDEYPDHPLAAQAWLERARYAQETDDVSMAMECYESVFTKFAQSSEAQQARLAGALLLVKAGSRPHLQDAVQWLSPLVDQQPAHPQLDLVYYQLAWAHRDLGETEESTGSFERLVREFPESTYRPDALYRLAEVAARGKDYERATEWIETLRADHPDEGPHEHATYLAAQIAAAEQDWSRLIDETTGFRESWPTSELVAGIRFWQAEGWYRSKSLDEAKLALDELRRAYGDRDDSWVPVVWLRTAQLAAIQEDWAEVKAGCDEISARFEDFRQRYEVDYLVGRYHGARGEFTQARQAYHRVIRSPLGRQTETAAMAQWMIGESYFHQERFRDAIDAYHRVATLFPYDRWQAAALLQSGKCHEQLRQYDHAITLYAQLLSEHSQSSFADEASQRLSIAKQRQGSSGSQER